MLSPPKRSNTMTNQINKEILVLVQNILNHCTAYLITGITPWAKDALVKKKIDKKILDTIVSGHEPFYIISHKIVGKDVFAFLNTSEERITYLEGQSGNFQMLEDFAGKVPVQTFNTKVKGVTISPSEVIENLFYDTAFRNASGFAKVFKEMREGLTQIIPTQIGESHYVGITNGQWLIYGAGVSVHVNNSAPPAPHIGEAINLLESPIWEIEKSGIMKVISSVECYNKLSDIKSTKSNYPKLANVTYGTDSEPVWIDPQNLTSIIAALAKYGYDLDNISGTGGLNPIAAEFKNSNQDLVRAIVMPMKLRAKKPISQNKKS